MAESIRKVAYFALGVADKPGEAARVLGAFAKEGISLLAFTGFPRGGRSQLDFVPKDPALFRRAAARAKLRIRKKKTGFLVQGDDRRGAVAKVVGRLAAAGINVTAIDAVAAGGGRYGAILWVKPGEVMRAARALGAR